MWMLITLDRDEAQSFPTLAAATEAACADHERRNKIATALVWQEVNTKEWIAADGFYRVVRVDHVKDWGAGGGAALMHDQSGSISVHHLVELSARLHDDRRFLAQCNLFRVLTADERATLIAQAQIRKYAANETIFLKGSTGDSMVVVLSGHVRISVASPERKEIIFRVLVAGEIFGEIDMLAGKERTADARAASECRLAILTRRDVLAFFEQHPNAWPRLVVTLCERLRNADEQIAEQAFMSTPVRLAKALLRLTAIEPQTGNRLSQVQLSQHEIGSLIGATRESVNRWLSRWQRMGILQIGQNLITVTDRHALEQVARSNSD